MKQFLFILAALLGAHAAHAQTAPAVFSIPLGPPIAAGDVAAYMDPATSTQANNCYPQISYISPPIYCAGWSLSKTFDSTYATHHNANLIASQVTTSGTSQAAAVALFGQGLAGSSATTGGGAWGINTNGYSVGNNTAIAAEFDTGNLVDPVANANAHAFGVVSVCTGTGGFWCDAGLQIQSNHPGSGAGTTRFKYGIRLNHDAFINDGIYADALNAQNGIKVVGLMTSAEQDWPSFLVGPTPPAGTAKLRIDASTVGEPVLSAVATGGLGTPATNGSVVIKGLGTGGVKVQDGGGNTIVQTAATSALGFYGAVPASKPTVTGSRGGNAALASLLTGLAGLGLLTDGTTP